MRITSPERAFRFFRARLARDVEEFWIATLNSQKAVTASRCLFRGTVDHCLFHPRDVFRFACIHNASSIVVAHNHPGGSPKPSPEDFEVTEQLHVLAVLLQIPLIDHLILGDNGFYSFLENGSLASKVKTLV